MFDEDLVREWIDLPADELAEFGVDRDVVVWCDAHRRTLICASGVRWAGQLNFTRGVYRFARQGVVSSAPRSRPCVATVLTLHPEKSCTASKTAQRRVPASVRPSARRGGPQVGAVGLVRAWWARAFPTTSLGGMIAGAP